MSGSVSRLRITCKGRGDWQGGGRRTILTYWRHALHTHCIKSGKILQGLNFALSAILAKSQSRNFLLDISSKCVYRTYKYIVLQLCLFTIYHGIVEALFGPVYVSS